MEEQVMECDVCGGGHPTEVCPELGLGDATTEPTQTLTKASLTVPNNLLHVVADGQNGVYAKEVLQPKTQFGPFEARRTMHEIANVDLFVLKILSKEKDGNAICLDTTDENVCNWMCLVGIATSEEEQNCMAYQLGTNIFYNTTKEVEAGHALKVWYSPHYARKLGRSEKPDGITKSMLGYIIQMSEETFQPPSPEVTTITSPAQRPTRRYISSNTEITKIFSDEKVPLWNNEDGMEESVVQTSDIFTYSCQRCTKTFEDQSELAYHIREHIIPSVEKKKSTHLYMCKICKVGFQTVSNYNRHMKRHVGYKVKCPTCNYFTYRGDILQTHLIGQHGVTLEDAKSIAAQAEIPSNQEGESFSRRGRRRKPGRKRKVIPQDLDDNEDDDGPEDTVADVGESVEDVVEAEEDASRTVEMLKAEDGSKEEILKEEGEISAEKEEEITEEGEITKEEGEITKDDDNGETAPMGLVSPIRIQPRRSLKGIRTTGALKGIKPTMLFKRERLGSDSEEEASPVKTPVVVPSTGRKRGRPRKTPLPEVQSAEVDPAPEAPKKKRGRPRKDANVLKLAEQEYADGDVAEPGEITKTVQIKVESKPFVGDEVCMDSAGTVAAAIEGDNTTGDLSVTYTIDGDSLKVIAPATDFSDISGTVAETPGDATSGTAGETSGTLAETSVTAEETSGTAGKTSVTAGETSGTLAETSGTLAETSGTLAETSGTAGETSGIAGETSGTAEETSGTVEETSRPTGETSATAEDTSETAAAVGDGENMAEGSQNGEAGDKETATLHLEDEGNDGNNSNDTDYVAPKLPKRRGRPLKYGRNKASELLELQKQVRKVGNAFQCCVCGKKFSQKKYLMLHLPKHTSKFKCDGCEKQFARHESFLNHACMHNSVSDDVITTDKNGCYSCVECGKIFSKPEYVKRHYSVHMSAWTCDKCTRTFSRRHLLLDHVCMGQNGSEIHNNHECEICKQCFRSLKYLFRHMAMHTDIFKCKGCEKTFSRKDSLQRHVLRCCPDMADDYKIYDCKNCKKTFSTKLGLENHYLHCANYSCLKCRVAFFQLEHLEQHKCDGAIIHASASMQFPCQECKKTFASINYLRRHEESHKGAFTCSMCEKSFSRKEEQKLHEHYCYALNQLETNSEVECETCAASFTEARAYRDHQHEHSHPFKCEKCGKRFIKVGTLTTHTCTEPINDDNPYTCPVCNRSFRSATYLTRHQTIHDKPQFECEYCHKHFYRRDYLNNHVCRLPDGPVVRLVRKRGRMFIKETLVCHLCGRTFVSSSNLNKHMKIHGEKQNTCPHCGKKFHYPTYLREHIKTVHQKAYQFMCEDCGKILHSKTGLSAHIKQFHSNQIQLYQCGTCQKTFRQKGNLKTHMYSHTKEKTFMCNFCNKMFKYPDQLNRHRLEHTMTTKLNCNYCDKKFCRQYQLKKHLQNFHSGIVYICDICNERCSHKHTIVRHYKRKHPEVSSVFDQPNYLSTLQKEQADAEAKLDVKPSIATIVQAIDQVETTVVTTDPGLEEQQVYTVAEIQTDGESYLPHVAAEALQNLSNSIIASEVEHGTLTIPSTLEGPDGQQTVVILQIVNPDDDDGSMQTIEAIQEVQEIMYTEESI